MSDRNNSLARTRKPSAGRHLALVPAASAPGTGSISGQLKSHIARLIDALHRSRRKQAVQVTRQYLHLVHDEQG